MSDRNLNLCSSSSRLRTDKGLLQPVHFQMLPDIFLIIKAAAVGGSSGRTAFVMTTVVGFIDSTHSCLEHEVRLTSRYSLPVCFCSSTSFVRLRLAGP